MAEISKRRRVLGLCGLVLVLVWGTGLGDAVLPSTNGSEPASLWQAPPDPNPPPEFTWGTGKSFGGTTVKIGSATVELPPLPLRESNEELTLYRELRAGKETELTLLFTAADVSGLTSPDDVAQFERDARAAMARVSRSLGQVDNPVERANALLVAMHREVFRQYEKEQPYPATALKTGLFNCVSATILYNLFARHVGLQTEAVGEPDHAYAVVRVGSQRFGVRTTIPNGFAEPLDAKASSLVVSNAALLGMAIEDRLAFNHDRLPKDPNAFDEPTLGVALALWRREALLSPVDARVQSAYATMLHDGAAYFLGAKRPEDAFSIAHQEVGAAPDARTRQVALIDLAIATGDWMQQLFKRNASARALEVFGLAYAAANCRIGSPDCAVLDRETTNIMLEAADALQNGPAIPQAELMNAIVTRLPPSQVDFVTKMSLLAAQHLWQEQGRLVGDDFLRKTVTPEVCGALPSLRCEQLTHWAALRWLAFNPQKALGWWRALP